MFRESLIERKIQVTGKIIRESNTLKKDKKAKEQFDKKADAVR
jgi:hypothetical protein